MEHPLVSGHFQGNVTLEISSIPFFFAEINSSTVGANVEAAGASSDASHRGGQESFLV